MIWYGTCIEVSEITKWAIAQKLTTNTKQTRSHKYG